MYFYLFHFFYYWFFNYYFFFLRLVLARYSEHSNACYESQYRYFLHFCNLFKVNDMFSYLFSINLHLRMPIYSQRKCTTISN